MARRKIATRTVRVGDTVIRRHRLLKTRGVVIRPADDRVEGGARVWVKWSHPDTLPNPSLEDTDDLEVES